MVKRVSGENRERAEALAIQALGFIAAEPDRLGRFLALSGIGPDAIRQAAREPGFLAALLDYVTGDQRLLAAFADAAGITPKDVSDAREALAGPDWERDAP